MTATRLDIGCGPTPREGFVGVDRSLGLEAFPLAYEDGSVDEIYASHVLEHFGHRLTGAVLSDWRRVLKPGGRIRIGVPNFRTIADCYLRGVPLPTEAFVMGGHVDDNDRHGSLFDYETLRDLLHAAGFIGVRPFEPVANDCTRHDISLNMEAFVPTREPKVRICYSTPRLIFVDNIFTAARLSWQTGWTMDRLGGAYWHHGISRVMQQALDDGVDYCVTVDYDTVFDPNDAIHMVGLMETMPDIGAMFPLQMGRRREVALFSAVQEEGVLSGQIDRKTLEKGVVDANSGHFGLTVIRADALRAMQKPWMIEQPGENYGDDRVDADISFWPRMRAAHWRTCCCTLVTVGHIQEYITYPDRELRPLQQSMEDHGKYGKPKGVWECL